MVDLRLDGLVSGVPTNDIVDRLMELERNSIRNLKGDKYGLEQEKEAWREINTNISTLQSELSSLKDADTFNSMDTSTSDENVVTASADSEASEGSYDVSVTQMAQSHRILGKQIEDANTEFQNLSGGLSGAFTSGTTELTLNGQSVEVSETDTLADFRDQVNEEVSGMQASIVDNHLVLEGTQTGLSNELSVVDQNNFLEEAGILAANDDSIVQSTLYEDSTAQLDIEGEFEITIDGTTEAIGVSAGDSLENIRDAINTKFGAGTASIEPDGDFSRLQIDGGGNKVTLENTSADDQDNIIRELSLGNKEFANEERKVQNAKVDINGITEITRETNTIRDAVEGVSFTVHSAGEEATVDVSKDTDKAVSAIEGFVEQYNKTQVLMDEKSKYDPEEDEAARLQGSGTLSRIQSNLRSRLTDRIGDESVRANRDYNTLAAVGIEISRNGVMSLDSNKLRSALNDNQEEVVELFTAEKDDGADFDGIAVQADEYMDMVLQDNDGVIPSTQDSYDRRIDNIESQIESTERRLERKRERLISEFTAMEKAISEMKSQQNQMMSQLGGMFGMGM